MNETMMLNKIRADKYEKKALLHALEDVEGEVYFFGSRTDFSKKGGDIDLLVFSKKDSFDLSRKISRRFFMECEEKIDVIVFDKDNLTEEQAAFISNLKLARII